MNENLERIGELLESIDLVSLDNDTLQLLSRMTLHQEYLGAIIESQDREIIMLHKKIEKIQDDNFEFTRKFCQNY